MKIRTAQRIDYWIGVPLCAAFSLLNVLSRGFRRPPAQPRRLLFIELSEMGSAVLSYSAFLRVRELFPRVELYFLVFERNLGAVELLGVFDRDRIIVIDDKSLPRFAVSSLGAWRRVLALGIDTVIDLELFSRFTTLFGFLSGARRRVGFSNFTNEGLFRGDLLTDPVFYNPHQHMSCNFMSLAEALSPALQPELPCPKADVRSLVAPPPIARPDARECRKVWDMLKREAPHIGKDSPIVVINPDPGVLPIRGWGVERFGEVVKALLRDDPAVYAVLIGLSSGKTSSAAIMAHAGSPRCLDLTGKTATVGEVATLFHFGKVLLTNDSGPAHFATLTPIRPVVLFGPETPALYGPLGDGVKTLFASYACSPCFSAANHRHTRCLRSRCLEAIPVSRVLDEVRSSLAEARRIPSRVPWEEMGGA